MNERDETRLRDMLDAARKAEAFMDGRTRLNLGQDEMLAFAVVRALEIVGEAASRVTTDTRTELAQIPWKDITGMRNKIIHDYDQVDLDVVWQTVAHNLPTLISELDRILAPDDTTA
jgi:uncharacterized protein with HEPN domain